jgi:hypothetical protein
MDTALVLLLIGAGHYALSPLVIAATSKVKANIEPREIGPQDFPAKLAGFFETQAQALEQIGFHRTAYLRVPETVTGASARMESYVVTMFNRETGDGAVITAILNVASGIQQVTTQYVELSTRYPDGRMFDTLNTQQLGAFARIPSETKTRLPGENDPRLLYALHRFVIGRNNVSGRPLSTVENDAGAWLAKEHVGSLDGQVRRGRYYLSKRTNEYRPTLKGAFLMSWGLMWPMSFFRRSAMHRRARKILQEFRAANPTLPPLPPFAA